MFRNKQTKTIPLDKPTHELLKSLNFHQYLVSVFRQQTTYRKNNENKNWVPEKA